MTKTDTSAIWETLDRIIDPELGIPITDLGLVYEVVDNDGEVAVVMTMTTPVCPLGSYFEREIKTGLLVLPGVDSVTVDMVFEPRWDPTMITDQGKQKLGWSKPIIIKGQ